jgi:NTE family protein
VKLRGQKRGSLLNVGNAEVAPIRSTFVYLFFIAQFAVSCFSPGAGAGTEQPEDPAPAQKNGRAWATLPAQTGPVQTQETAVDNNARRPKIMLALGGGGTRGLAHIGVLRVLEREGIPIDGIAGTSMGAIVGGLYSAGLTPDQIEDLMRNKSILHAYDTVPIPVRVAVVPLFAIPHAFGYHPYDGLYRGNKFASFIETVVPPSKHEIESFRIPFCAVATDLLEGKPYCITHGKIGRAIQASSALPGLRRPLPWQGKLLVDGGVLQNLPTEQAKDMGADIVIAVDVGGVHKKMSKKDFRRIGSVTFRCINLHLAAIDAYPSTHANVVVRPRVGDIGLLSRDMHDITVTIQEGEKSTESVVPAIRAEIERVTTELAEGKQQ